MSDKEKNINENEETFEDIFSNLREKYNLDPFEAEEESKADAEEEKVFYNPAEDSEIDDFFKEREEGYTALYEEVDAQIAGVDDEILRREAEEFNLHFDESEQIEIPKSEKADMEFEDVYSSSASEEAAEEEDVIPTPYLEGESESSDEEADAQEENEAEENFEEEPKKQKNSFFPQKCDSTGEKIRKIVFLVSIVALVISSCWLINDYLIQPYLISKQNSEISSLIDDGEDVDAQAVVEKLDNLNEEEKTVTFESLKKSNKDFKAWLVVPGANISLPVVQTTDNSKYLNTGFNGKWISGGTAFIDSQNKSAFSDMNTVIYGHNMRDGSMFGSIKNYKSIKTYKDNPLIHVYTENENYVYKIYSVFLSNAVASEDNGYVFGYTFKNLSTDENFISFMEEIKKRSYYDTGVDYQAGDKLLTLSTCDRTVIKNGRLVIVARLVRENEEEAVDTGAAKVNSNQKFPAGWYSKKKQNNPFENDVRWIAQ